MSNIGDIARWVTELRFTDLPDPVSEKAKEVGLNSWGVQLAASTLCTNRDLPLNIPISKTATDFTLESSAPVESVRAAIASVIARSHGASGPAGSHPG